MEINSRNFTIMRITDIFEARKNPEKNPKISINKFVIRAINDAPNDVAGTTNAFVSFTTVDKLGINPKSKYDTPIGIYAYPADYVLTTARSTKRMTALPFAGESEYVNIFNAAGNIINIATIAAPEVRGYYKKIAELWASISGMDWKTSVDHIERYINNAGSKAKFPDYPGGQLWYVTMMASREFFSSAWKTTAPVAWNKLFRSIGIDGVVDYTDEGGVGIIHTSEPTQAVFFTINSVKNVKRYDNKYSPSAVSQYKDFGKTRHDEVSNAAKKLNAATTAQEVLKILSIEGFENFRLVKDKAIRKEILKKEPQLIGRLPNATPEEQSLVLSIDPEVFRLISKPDEAVLLNLIKTDPGVFAYISGESVVNKLPNAGFDLQKFVIDNDIYQFQFFKRPNPKAIKLALDKFTQYNTAHPKWLIKLAKVYKVPFTRVESDMVKDVRRNLEVLKKQEANLKQDITTLQDEWAKTEQILVASGKQDMIAKVKKYYDRDIAIVKEQLAKTQDRIQRDIAWIEKELESN